MRMHEHGQLHTRMQIDLQGFAPIDPYTLSLNIATRRGIGHSNGPLVVAWHKNLPNNSVFLRQVLLQSCNLHTFSTVKTILSGMTFLKHPLSSICSWNHALPCQHPFQISLEYHLLFLWCIFPVSLEDGGSLTGVELGDGVFNIEKPSPWLVGHPVDGRTVVRYAVLCQFKSIHAYCTFVLFRNWFSNSVKLSLYCPCSLCVARRPPSCLYIDSLAWFDRTGCQGLNGLRITSFNAMGPGGSYVCINMGLANKNVFFLIALVWEIQNMWTSMYRLW